MASNLLIVMFYGRKRDLDYFGEKRGYHIACRNIYTTLDCFVRIYIYYLLGNQKKKKRLFLPSLWIKKGGFSQKNKNKKLLTHFSSPSENKASRDNNARKNMKLWPWHTKKACLWSESEKKIIWIVVVYILYAIWLFFTWKWACTCLNILLCKFIIDLFGGFFVQSPWRQIVELYNQKTTLELNFRQKTARN